MKLRELKHGPIHAWPPRLRTAVEGRTFVGNCGPEFGPTFYRARKDCVAAMRKRSR